jgi:hypothetical protein
VRRHPRLTHRGSWTGHDGPLPIVEGTLSRLRVEHLPGQREATPGWRWSSPAGDDIDDIDDVAVEVIGCWQAYLRRFDDETSKPQCCHSWGWSASRWAPSCLMLIRAA